VTRVKVRAARGRGLLPGRGHTATRIAAEPANPHPINKAGPGRADGAAFGTPTLEHEWPRPTKR